MSEIKPFTGVDDRVKLSECIPLNSPFTLNIFPSNVCNFKCNYCAQSLGQDAMYREYGLKPDMMSLKTVDCIVEQSHEFKNKYKLISMMGHGEPLCNKNLPEMIYKIKCADIAERIDIISNASLLTHELSDKLIESGLDVLRVSLQGINSESYKETCGVNINYNKFFDNLLYFYNHSRNKNCKIYVKTMDVSLKGEESDKFYEMFRNISDRMYIDKVKPVYDKVNYTNEQRDVSTDRYGNKHSKRIVCPQPFYMLSVWANGDVTPCDALYKANVLGNVHNKNLHNMWLNNNHKNFCIYQLEGKRFEHNNCSRCCAPDDVVHKEDILDDAREKILQEMKK